jgi:hypothetical protein
VRAVLDPNVLVAALLSSGGAPAIASRDATGQPMRATIT